MKHTYEVVYVCENKKVYRVDTFNSREEAEEYIEGNPWFDFDLNIVHYALLTA